MLNWTLEEVLAHVVLVGVHHHGMFQMAFSHNEPSGRVLNTLTLASQTPCRIRAGVSERLAQELPCGLPG